MVNESYLKPTYLIIFATIVTVVTVVTVMTTMKVVMKIFFCYLTKKIIKKKQCDGDFMIYFYIMTNN